MGGIVVACYIFLLNFLVFICFKQVKNVYDKLYELEKLNQKMKEKEKYYKELEERQYEIRKMKHDIKNQLLEWNGERKDALAQEFVDDMLEKLTEKKKYCENSVINNILEEKIAKAERNNISVFHDICVADNLRIAPGDMGILIGNLLDNAIEASECVEEPLIKICMVQKNNNVLIQIENKKKEGEKCTNWNTTKENKWNHGFGLKSVRQVVKKYDGIMEVETIGQIFYVKIVIFL